MLPGNLATLFKGAGAAPAAKTPVDLTLLDVSSTGFASGSSHTFSMNCGAGGAVVLCVQIYSSNLPGAVTIGGVAATQRIVSPGSQGAKVAIYTAPAVPAGIQNVVINLNGGTSSRWGAQLYSIKDYATLEPFSVASDISHYTGSPQSVLNVPEGGAVIASAEEATGTAATGAWTGLTTDYSAFDGSFVVYSAGSKEIPAGDAAFASSVTFSGGTTLMANAVWAVWKGNDPAHPTLTRELTAVFDADVITHNNVPIGAAAADRVVVIALNFASSVSTMTINGSITATKITEVGNCSLWRALVPTGTTMNVVLNIKSYIFTVWALYGAAPAPTFSGAVIDKTMNVDVPVGGMCLATMATNDGSAGQTWTGLDKDYMHPGGQLGSAGRRFNSGATGATVSVATAGSAIALNMIAASWGPA